LWLARVPGFATDSELEQTWTHANKAWGDVGGAQGLYKDLTARLKWHELKNDEVPQDGDIVFLLDFQDPDSAQGFLHEGIYYKGAIWNLDHDNEHVSLNELSKDDPVLGRYFDSPQDKVVYVRPNKY